MLDHCLDFKVQKVFSLRLTLLHVWGCAATEVPSTGKTVLELHILRPLRFRGPSVKDLSKLGKMEVFSQASRPPLEIDLARFNVLATASRLRVTLSTTDYKKVAAHLFRCSLSMTSARDRVCDPLYPRSVTDDSLKGKWEEVQRLHGTVLPSPSILSVEPATVERRDRLELKIYERVSNFRAGVPRVDRCPCCARKVEIFYGDKEHKIGVHYLTKDEQAWPDSAEDQSEIVRGFQEHPAYCPAMGLLKIRDLLVDGTVATPGPVQVDGVRVTVAATRPNTTTADGRARAPKRTAGGAQETAAEEQPAKKPKARKWAAAEDSALVAAVIASQEVETGKSPRWSAVVDTQTFKAASTATSSEAGDRFGMFLQAHPSTTPACCGPRWRTSWRNFCLPTRVRQ